MLTTLLPALDMQATAHVPVLTPRIVHIHIPKTAGTALRTALHQAYGSRCRVCPSYDDKSIAAVDPQSYDIVSGHIGWKTTTRFNADVIVVLRNPVDRFLSVYFFLRQLALSGKEDLPTTRLASRFDLDQFVQIRDEPPLLDVLQNRATWQLAHDANQPSRREMRMQSKTDDDVFAMAWSNLGACAVVGIQEQMGRLTEDLKAKYGVQLTVQALNVTGQRLKPRDISMATLRKIHDWIYMDIELYSCPVRLLSAQ